MSDPSSELCPALKALLRADAGVIAAFGSTWATSRVVEIAPTNLAPPYVVINGPSLTPELAECLDGCEAELTIDVWSHTVPPAYTEARTIGSAVQAAVMGSSLTLASHRVSNVERVRAAYLADAQSGDVHGVLTLRFHTEPL